MFYCEDCREKNGWPDTWAGSYGACEICKNVTFCHDKRTAYILPEKSLYVDPSGIIRRKNDHQEATYFDLEQDARIRRDWRNHMRPVTF